MYYTFIWYNPQHSGIELSEEDENLLDHIAADTTATGGFSTSVGSVASVDTSRRTIKSYVLTSAAARGGPGPFRKRLLKELKHMKMNASVQAMNTDTDVLLQTLRDQPTDAVDVKNAKNTGKDMKDNDNKEEEEYDMEAYEANEDEQEYEEDEGFEEKSDAGGDDDDDGFEVSVWVYECMSVWVYECMNVWVYECMSVWMYECMSVWVYECMSVWVYECMSV